MLLSAQILNLYSVNSYEIAQSAFWTIGDTTSFYLRLVDASLDRPEQGFYPAGRRYVPASGSTLQVKFNAITSTVASTKTAVQPFPTLDPSIWRVDITSTDKFVGSMDLILVLNEAGTIKNGRVPQAINVHNVVESF